MNIQNLEVQYLKAKVAYYEGNPIMSDAAFDVLENQLKEVGSKVIEQVGSKRKDFDFPHPTPMKSLAKIQTETVNGVTNYQEDAYMDWFTKRQRIIDFPTDVIHFMYYTPKFDGSAINIIYSENNLQAVITRGDGKKGKDVTDRFSNYIPKTFITEGKVVEIRCEAVMNKKVFEEKYAKEFANARNLVAGIIGKDEFDVNKVADITLIPLHYIVDGEHRDLKEFTLKISAYPIFGETCSTRIHIGYETYLSAVKHMEAIRNEFEYPLDGIVFSFPTPFRKQLGENEHDPEWAIAIKFVPDEVITEVVGIEWNLGKTGELTPVVKLKPVELAGTTVRRASGYNAGQILKNKIGKGAFVSIAKAGDIIPEIQDVTVEGETEEFPKVCPACGELLTFDGIHLMCNNDNCSGRIARKLGSAVAMLDLKDIGGKTIEPFAKDFSNIYELFKWVYTNGVGKDIEKYGIKYGSRSHEIFVHAFGNIKSLAYAQVILMMGYDGVGRKLAEQAAREYCGLVPDYSSMEKALVDKLRQKDIVSYIKEAVTTLESLGVTIDKPVDKVNNENTIYVCMTGSPSPINKTKEEFIKSFTNVNEVSITDKNCQYLLTNSLDAVSSKMKIAEKKGIIILTYSDFKAKFNSK